MGNNNTLPVEVLEQINKDSVTAFPNSFPHNISHTKAVNGYRAGYCRAAIEYATKLQEAKREIKTLTTWKQEATTILDPIFNYAEHIINVPLGKSKTEAVVKHAEDAKVLLNEVFQKHESGLLPDRFIYNKIKMFLYGE